MHMTLQQMWMRVETMYVWRRIITTMEIGGKESATLFAAVNYNERMDNATMTVVTERGCNHSTGIATAKIVMELQP